jgi:hypothetical protein
VRPNIFFAAMLKSGSTHIKVYTQTVTGLPYGHVVHKLEGCDDQEQQISVFLAQVLFPLKGHLYCHHVRGTQNNAEMLKLYDVKPVAIMRNALDCLVSFEEWLMKEKKNVSTFVVPNDWFYWDEVRRYEWLCYNVLPWYLSFYSTWVKHPERLIVWYEEFFADETEGMMKILDYYGFTTPKSMVTLAAPEKKWRFNKGVSGRGWDKLGDMHLLGLVQTQVEAWNDDAMYLDLIERRTQ